MADQFFMTQKGYDEAVERLKFLQTTKRQEIIERIAEARSHGDLSENAEYDAARNEQAMNEGEILELEAKIKNAKIVEESTDISKIHFGSKVRVYDYDMEEEAIYTLMGTTEADPMNNVISIDSPFGKALLGSAKGAVVTVHAPGGDFKVEIKEILE